MQVRRVRVQIHTETLRVTGLLQLPTEGYRSRTTDFMNSHDTGFFALTEAEVDDGTARTEHDFVAIGARHVVTLVELEDLGTIDSDSPQTIPIAPTSVPPPAGG